MDQVFKDCVRFDIAQSMVVKKKWQKSSGGYKVRLFGQHEEG